MVRGAGGFLPPRIYSPDIGAVDHKGIVETKVGVFFQSDKGLYLIPRGFGPPLFLGSAVRGEMQMYSKVFGSDVSTANQDHLARWLVGTAGATGADRVLSYDVEGNRWFKDTYQTPSGGLAELGAWPNGFAMAGARTGTGSTQYLFYENGETTDAGSKIRQYAKTDRIYPFGPNGWGKIKKVMVGFRVYSDTNLTLTVHTDGNADQSGTWAVTASSDIQYRMIDVKRNACTSIQVEALAVGSSADGRIKLISCALEVDPQNGLRETQVSERA